jgi:hypothetical protein
MNIEINPGIIISKLDIKDGDIITVTIDTDKWDLNHATEMLYAYKEIFPNNKVVGELKGMEISAGAGSSSE